MSEILRFQPNQPERIVLKRVDGRPAPASRIPGAPEEVMFSLIDERLIFVPTDVAQQIHEQRIAPGEPVVIQKLRARGSTGFSWEVKRPDGAAPEVPPSNAAVPARPLGQGQPTHPTKSPADLVGSALDAVTTAASTRNLKLSSADIAVLASALLRRLGAL